MKVTQDPSYLNRLLMYKGVFTPEDLLRAGGDPLTRATYGYAVGSWYLLQGRRDEARRLSRGWWRGRSGRPSGTSPRKRTWPG